MTRRFKTFVYNFFEGGPIETQAFYRRIFNVIERVRVLMKKIKENSNKEVEELILKRGSDLRVHEQEKDNGDSNSLRITYSEFAD